MLLIDRLVDDGQATCLLVNLFTRQLKKRKSNETDIYQTSNRE
ncbi:hypothetical protein HMPREF0649_00877 [Segatella buccae D17]|nr:hypothetical protein HMPREF0649_00877 [Segatella buccae D17]